MPPASVSKIMAGDGRPLLGGVVVCTCTSRRVDTHPPGGVGLMCQQGGIFLQIILVCFCVHDGEPTGACVYIPCSAFGHLQLQLRLDGHDQDGGGVLESPLLGFCVRDAPNVLI